MPGIFVFGSGGGAGGHWVRQRIGYFLKRRRFV